MKPEPILLPGRITKPCDVCGTLCSKKRSQASLWETWTCSHECSSTIRMKIRMASGNWKRPQKKRRGSEYPCDHCKKPTYFTQKQRLIGRRFCSKKCHDLSQLRQLPVTCTVCKKKFMLPPSRISGVKTCSRECYVKTLIKRPTGKVHNGKPAKLDLNGYVMIWEPSNPNKTQKGWQYEHRMVVEKEIGRTLLREEEIHHINGIKNDNRPENLQILDAQTHKEVTAQQMKDRRKSVDDELSAYRARYGPLTS